MSKEDQLGASSSFARASQARSVRRQLTEAAFGGDAPNTLPTNVISANPDNPRESVGDVTGLASSLREIGQIQAITVASVEAYLRDRPGREHELDEGAEYVVVDGARRLEGARQAGLPTMKVHVDDSLVTTDEALLEAAFVANWQRENLSELEEAQALKTLVEFYGSQRKASVRLGVTQAFISQRLSLLALAPELQADLASGARKVEHVRGLAKLAPEEQRAAADARAAKAERERQEHAAQQERSASVDNAAITPASPPAPSKDDAEAPVGDNAVITSSSSAGASGATAPPTVAERSAAAPSDNAVITPPSSPSRPDGSVPSAVDRQLPWRNPHALDRILREHMDDEDRLTLAKLLAR